MSLINADNLALARLVNGLLLGLVDDTDIDPNSKDIPSFVRTTHINTPDPSIPWFIITIKSGKSKSQLAIAAGGPDNRLAYRAIDTNGSMIGNWTPAVADVPNLPASKITSGVFAAARIPTLNQNTTGSAATLTTARSLTIGASSKTFNGSANVTWSLAEMGAVSQTAFDTVLGDIESVLLTINGEAP